jgi:hypothetical protein
VNQKRRRSAAIIGTGAVVLLAMLVIAPKFLRSRISDGGPVGARNVRMLNLAQGIYSSTYPSQGYASNLAALGPNRPDAANQDCQPSAARACLIDAQIGCATGVGTEWCTKGPYHYSIQSTSSKPPYSDYWITAAALQAGPDKKIYCSASDGILRSSESVALARPYTLAECLALPIDR